MKVEKPIDFDEMLRILKLLNIDYTNCDQKNCWNGYFQDGGQCYKCHGTERVWKQHKLFGDL